MPTTAKTILESAWARSSANDPTTLATRAELIGVVDRLIKGWYSFAAKLNPTYFGKTSDVTPASSKWAMPTDAVMIFKAESAGGGADKNIATSGTRIFITPFGDQQGEQSPAIYKFGRSFLTVGRASDPDAAATGDIIKFYYSMRHPSLDGSLDWEHATNTLDATWPEHFNDLLIVPLARYLRVKDEAEPGDIAALEEEIKALEAAFAGELTMQDFGVSARFGQRRVISTAPKAG